MSGVHIALAKANRALKDSGFEAEFYLNRLQHILERECGWLACDALRYCERLTEEMTREREIERKEGNL